MIQILPEDFQRFADRSQDAIYRLDIESQTFTFFNKLFLDLFGTEKNGVKALSWRDSFLHIHPDDIEKVKRERVLTLRGGGPDGENEYRLINPDGSIRWMHDKWTVIRDRKGRAVAIEGFIRDNTRRKQMEEELEWSRHNAMIGSYIIQNAQFRYVNPEFCRITGYSESELIGTHPLDLVHDNDKARVKKRAMEMLKGRNEMPYEFCIVDKSGRIKWIMETITPILFKGHRAVLGYFMDITAAKSAEAEKREKEKLQAILEMAGAVGHEMNTPLQVILVCSEKISRKSLESGTVDRQIQLLRKNVQRLVNITRKIQSITQYRTMDYVQGIKIIDIDAASNGEKGI